MAEQPSNPTEAGAFFQKPAFNAAERLICSHLIEASHDDPLLTVSHITRAALSLTKAVAAQLIIDQEQAKSLYTVSQRLQTVSKQTTKWGDEKYAAHLSTLNKDKDINTWRKLKHYNFLYYDEDKPWVDSVSKDEENKLFDFCLNRLSLSGYQTMLSDFLEYAIPIVEEMGRKLATLVSPETYTEMLALYYGEKKP